MKAFKRLSKNEIIYSINLTLTIKHVSLWEFFT